MIQWAGDHFKEAAIDYYGLLNRNYPERPTIKLVGDRYRLNGAERMALYRGITAAPNARRRKKKIAPAFAKEFLYIDGYNVFFSIMNYLLGKPVFISNDGFLRDCGETYGRVKNQEIFSRALSLVDRFLEESNALGGEILLDASNHRVDHHIREWQTSLNGESGRFNVSAVKFTDQALTSQEKGILATSDSEIIDRTARPLYDLAANTLYAYFTRSIFNLETLLV